MYLHVQVYIYVDSSDCTSKDCKDLCNYAVYNALSNNPSLVINIDYHWKEANIKLMLTWQSAKLLILL